MDEVDRMLSSVKPKSPPGLEQRTRSEFRRRRRRQVIAHSVFSLAMIAAGLWLLLPAAGIINLPGSGLGVLQRLVQVSTSGAAMDAAFSGIKSLQSSLSASLGPANWLGLVALGVGLMLGMNALLPGRNNEF